MAKKIKPHRMNPLYKPTLNQGSPLALPESRPNIVAKLQSMVNENTFCRQDYSNGEFISSSLCVANTFENLCKCPTLDGPGYTAHWCEATQLWWRMGGCFD